MTKQASTMSEGEDLARRRNELVKIEKNVQKRWEEAKVFQVDAEDDDKPKYFGCFPMPYMNGPLHLGHAFSISKLEFSTAYHRLRGENVLFPFGFHCSGMSIPACAHKLDREISYNGKSTDFPQENEIPLEFPQKIQNHHIVSHELQNPRIFLQENENPQMFSQVNENPPEFLRENENPLGFPQENVNHPREFQNPQIFSQEIKSPQIFPPEFKTPQIFSQENENPQIFSEEVQDPQKNTQEDENSPALLPIDKNQFEFGSNSGKKMGNFTSQWRKMQRMGIGDEGIAEFRETSHWVEFFPRLAIGDLKSFGAGVDWRRSFITTPINPFFDSFVQWQMKKLRKQGKIVRDKKLVIYSPLEGQPCGDHDRDVGEAVQIQEYTLIKMEIVGPFSGKLKVLEGRRVYLAAATLRPEGMYGQTNAWVLPQGKYGAFEINENGDVFIMTQRAALNLAYQEQISKTPDKPLIDLMGFDLIGLPVKSPYAAYERIHVLPMTSVLENKGTGVVTSVPSDSPDDYMALHDLKTIPALREKLGVKDEWVMPFEVVPIIKMLEFGEKSAETVCRDFNIMSQDDTEEIRKAKKLLYSKGFNDGIMLVGEFKGRKVKNMRFAFRKKLVADGKAVIYSEPKNRVVSRSGDKCVVALSDQWYLTYGERKWKRKARECLEGMELHETRTKKELELSVNWVNHWAFSRLSGLGTQIPWDEKLLFDSLSDSTIYMAYCTIAHFLHGVDINGNMVSTIKPEQMSEEVWDYIFTEGAFPKSDIPSEALTKMRKEFEYWYPCDVLSSGMDLIKNHLTFCIFNHTAIFPKQKWPQSMRCYGHLVVDSEKMSNSAGNFMTLSHAIHEFSSDATRFALADTGDDAMDNVQFAFETPCAAISHLTNEITWMEEEIMGNEESLRQGPIMTFVDDVFQNDINIAVNMTEQNFNKMMFKDVLKTGFYNLRVARNEYSESCGLLGMKMRKDLLWRYLDVQTRLITPICPHYAEHVWKEILQRDGFAVKAGWPRAEASNSTLQAANTYLKDTVISFRELLQKKTSLLNNSLEQELLDSQHNREHKLNVGIIYVAGKYEEWQKECMNILKQMYGEDGVTSLHYKENRQESNDKNKGQESDGYEKDGGEKEDGEEKVEEELLAALEDSHIGQGNNFEEIKDQCLSFMRSMINHVIAFGSQSLNIELPFEEIQILEENHELIRRQLDIDILEISSFSYRNAYDQTGSYLVMPRQHPPSPGNPVAVFMSTSEYQLTSSI